MKLLNPLFRLLSFSIIAVTITLLSANIGIAADSDGPLKLLKTFKPGGEGGWDYITVDSAARRVYVSHATKVEVLDADEGTKVGEITDTPGIHGIAVVPELNIGFTTNGRENMLSVFDLKTLKTLRKIKSGQNPDAILYDPASKKIFAFNGRSGDVTVVDPAALDTDPVSIPVGGKLEAGVADNGRILVNVEDKNEIAVINIKDAKVVARWPLAPGERPTGLALDAARHRLYAACNKKMIVLDSERGTVLTSIEIGSGSDGAGFDPQLGLAISSNGGDGTITSIREEPAGTFKVVQTLPTARSARTMTIDPKTHQVYLPARATVDGVQVFEVLVVGVAR